MQCITEYYICVAAPFGTVEPQQCYVPGTVVQVHYLQDKRSQWITKNENDICDKH